MPDLESVARRRERKKLYLKYSKPCIGKGRFHQPDQLVFLRILYSQKENTSSYGIAYKTITEAGMTVLYSLSEAINIWTDFSFLDNLSIYKLLKYMNSSQVTE